MNGAGQDGIPRKPSTLTPEPSGPFEWIDRREQLPRLADVLSAEPAVGMDLEADSLFHFQERVCLIQLAASKRVFLVDPLALPDLSALRPLCASSSVTKVLHGADYDLRSLDRDFRIHIHPLFDTQIAARFLGLQETGLANLLETRFGIHAEKKFQKKDWSVRPLPEPMLRYGAQDAAYLVPLYVMLRDELRALGRLSWVEEECEILSRVRHAVPDQSPLFLRLRGAGGLDARGLAVADALLRFRLEVARRRNRPPFKVLANTTILEMARKPPSSWKALCAVPGLSKGQLRALGAGLLEAVQDALALPEDALPVYPRRRFQRQGPVVVKRVRALKAWRDRRSAELHLDPPVLLTNAQIQAVSEAGPSGPEELSRIEPLRRWQQESFGEEICRAMATASRP